MSPDQDLDLSTLVKPLRLPERFTPPPNLSFGDLHAHAISRADLVDDVAGINASLDLIRRTRGGDWPSDAVTHDGNYVDLVWHECEWRDRKSFTYAVRHELGAYVGCCYFYPLGVRSPLTAELLEHDVDVSWWVTPAAFETGHYDTLTRAAREWAATAYPFTHPHYSKLVAPAD